MEYGDTYCAKMKKKMPQFMCRPKWHVFGLNPSNGNGKMTYRALSRCYLCLQLFGGERGRRGKLPIYIKGGMKDNPLFSSRFIPGAHFSGNSPHFLFHGRITPEQLSSGKGRRIYLSPLLPVYFRGKCCRRCSSTFCILTLWWINKSYKRNALSSNTIATANDTLQ